MTAHAHPAPETVAALRAREPGTTLFFAVGSERFAAYDQDAIEVNRLLGAATGTVFFADTESGHWYVSFPAGHLQPLLAAVVAAGGRAAVCEPAKEAPRGVPIERVAVPGEATDVADRWEC